MRGYDWMDWREGGVIEEKESLRQLGYGREGFWSEAGGKGKGKGKG